MIRNESVNASLCGLQLSWACMIIVLARRAFRYSGPSDRGSLSHSSDCIDPSGLSRPE